MRAFDLSLQFLRAIVVVGILVFAFGCQAGGSRTPASASLAGAETASARAGESLTAIGAATADINVAIASTAIAEASQSTTAAAESLAQIGSLADRGRAKPSAGTLDAIRREVGRGNLAIAESRQRLEGAGVYVAKVGAAIATVRERVAAAVQANGESRQQLAAAQAEASKAIERAAELERKRQDEITAERTLRMKAEASIGYRIEQGVRTAFRVTVWVLVAGVILRIVWLFVGGRVLGLAATATEAVGTFGLSTIVQSIYKFGAARAVAKAAQ